MVLHQRLTLVRRPLFGHLFDGVNRLDQLRHVLTHVLVLQQGLVVTVEVRRKIDDDPFVRKSLTAVRDTLGRTGCPLLLLVEVLKRLSVHQIQH